MPKGVSTTTPSVKKPPKRLTVQLPIRSKIVPLPLPEPIDDTPGPFSFWGSIYDFDGRKIAHAFSGVSEDKMVIAHTVEGYKRPRTTGYMVGGNLPPRRTFVGTCQPSWGLGANPIIKELGKRRSRVNDVGDHGTRWFIGKEDLLRCPVIVYSKSLPSPNPFTDLSSLSSLSESSDTEVVVRTSVSPKCKLVRLWFHSSMFQPLTNLSV